MSAILKPIPNLVGMGLVIRPKNYNFSPNLHPLILKIFSNNSLVVIKKRLKIKTYH